MKICFDARKWSDGGIGSVIRLLVQMFVQNGIELITIARSEHRRIIEEITGNPVLLCDAKNYSLAELVEVGKLANQTHADLFYSPHYIVPINLKLPCVSLIHDTIQMQFPDQFSLLQRSYAKYMIGRALRKSDLIITQCETVKSDLIQRFPNCNREKIHPIRMCIDPVWFTEPGRISLPIPEQYCIYFGAYRKHKNLQFLAEMWTGSSNLPPLIITGDRLERYPEFHKSIHPLLNSKRWIDLGEVDFSTLRALVKSAYVGVFPSKYEGFGLPPLESMASGIPVLVSNCGAFPEVSGGGATVIPVTDPDQWISEIAKLGDLERYRERCHKGSNWVKTFDIEPWIQHHIQICQLALTVKQ